MGKIKGLKTTISTTEQRMPSFAGEHRAEVMGQFGQVKDSSLAQLENIRSIVSSLSKSLGDLANYGKGCCNCFV